MATEQSSDQKTCGSKVNQCLHCGAPVACGVKFCCKGCETAHKALGHKFKGLSDDAVIDDNGYFHLTVSVTGIHCSSCIQLIEQTLLQEDGVQSARVNMSTQRLTYSWKGLQEEGDLLAEKIAKLGYGIKPSGAESKKDENLRSLIYAMSVAGFGMCNVMLISVSLWSDGAASMGEGVKSMLHWVSALIALPCIFYSARPFFKSAWGVLKNKHTNMDVPISLAVILASAMSVVQTMQHAEHIYFDSALMLIFFLLIGRVLDTHARGKARQSAEDLLSKLRGYATIKDGDGRKVIPISELEHGMTVYIAAGENIPADGIVISGETETDNSIMTGETLPVYVGQGGAVFSGTLNVQNSIVMTVSKKSENSLLSQIVKLMEKAEQSGSHFVCLADRAAKLYTPVVHFMGLMSFLFWFAFMGMDWQPALLIAITVLIITCPCALGLAVPVVQILASGLLMKKGILLKSGDALEKLDDITIAVFDKTGTLTVGKPQLKPSHYDEEDLKVAASLASHSKHPLSRALCEKYHGDLYDVSDFKEHSGKGIEGIIHNKHIKIGKRAWCDVPDDAHHDAALELWLRMEERTLRFYFTDKLREDAATMVKALHKKDIKTMLLSGDRLSVVKDTAQSVGISDYKAEQLPDEKCAVIEQLKADGHKVLMVGDGLNDAPSLAMADISISPSSALDIAQNTADIVLGSHKLMPIIEAYDIAKMSKMLVKQNFGLAVIYNIFAIPIAVMGYVTPMIAALAMSGSSLLVIGNSFRLNMNKKREES